MGRLAGFRYKEVARRLRALGWVFDRHGPGSHEVWRHAGSGRKVTVPHHVRDMAEGTLRAILREGGIGVDAFLEAWPSSPMATAYEQLLSRELQWALREGSMHFEEKSAVHVTLRRITQRLRELNVPYAVAGGMALFFHGFRRFTEDVDILVTPEGLRQIHDSLESMG